MNTVKKVAVINDLSGIGRCSLTAAIPILSALGVQCCPFPTAVLSCQTGYDEFTFLDITDEMYRYKKSWDKLNVKFDCIYSGFLGSEEQINIVYHMAKEHEESLIVIDPVMGDDGYIYDTFTENMSNKMKELIRIADIVTPNLTEACLLTGSSYKKYNTSDEELIYMAKKIGKLGPKVVIITGIVRNNKMYNFAYDIRQDEYFLVGKEFVDKSFSGTGDTFASILIGLLLNDHNLQFSIEKAAEFLYKAIKHTDNLNTDPKEGILFEVHLKELILINEE